MIRTEWLEASSAPGGGSARPVAVLTLDRPEKKNALTPQMLDELRCAVSQASGRAGAVVLAGAGPVFCSGFDLTLCRDVSDALRELLTGLSGVIRMFRDCPAPVVVAAHGAAIAGGCALLAGADAVVTHGACRLGYPVVRLGISPAVNASFLLDAIGPGTTREWLLGGQILSGQEAFRRGLAHELVDAPKAVRESAVGLAMNLASKPAGGLSATKRWLNQLSLAPDAAERGLLASLTLVGGDEERQRLASLWA